MKLLSCLIIVLICMSCSEPKETSLLIEKQKTIRTSGPIEVDSILVKKYKYEPLYSIYSHFDFQTLWHDSIKRQKALQVLSKTDDIGLPRDLYRYDFLKKRHNQYDQLTDFERVHLDLLLTKSLRHFVSHAGFGQTRPERVYHNWQLPLRTQSVTQLVIQGIEGDSLQRVVDRIQPSHPIYRGLVKALRKIDDMPNQQFPDISISQKIKKGDTLPQILQAKKILMAWGDLRKQENPTAVLDRATVNAIVKFEKRNGLPVTGTLTPTTVSALNQGPARKRKQIVANLERWRWFPQEYKGRYLMVNIPDYSLYLMKDQDTLEFRKIVVGKAERSTPVLISALNEIILNPTWTVPPTIIKEDLGPDAAKDTNYFKNRRLTIYDWRNNLIKPSQWDATKPENYRYVQDPGDDNSLGNVKFNFPNRFMVYLHDTNHRDYFSRHRRSLSSGCVRVENPLELAKIIIDDTLTWNMDKIKEVVATKETTSIYLRERPRIYQLYWTAWVDQNGILQFRPDVYNLDSTLYSALRKKG